MNDRQDPASTDRAEIDGSLAGAPVPQEYGGRPGIEGVRALPLQRFVEDGGSLMELARLEGGRLLGGEGFDLRQITFSEVQPGVVKAWHVHRLQDDIWFVPPDQRLLVGLWDLRRDSPSRDVTQRLVLGDGQARLLFIPRGVAHGAANPYARPAHMLYLLNRHFQAEATDELRLPWDARGDAFWRPTPG